MPSLPPSDPSSFRHLGNAQRSGTAPAMLGLAAVLVLIAVPLYLWRRPKAVTVADAVRFETDAGVVDAAAPVVAQPASSAPKLSLLPARTIRCRSRGGRFTKERCDDLVVVEDALVKAVRDNIPCAPAAAQPYSVSFVLTVDFDRKRTHLWAGRSGTLKRRAANDLIRCVEHAISLPDLGMIPHQFARYDVNVMASYPPVAGGQPMPAAPTRTSLVPSGGT